MIKSLKILLIFIISLSLFFAFETYSMASSELNMNTSQATTEASADNTSVVLREYQTHDTSTAGPQPSDIINILLIAVGFVIILFAVAILIRLKNK